MCKLRNKKTLVIAFILGILAFFAIQAIMGLLRDNETVFEPAIHSISSSEAREKINEHQDAFILDVRTHEEFYQRRIPGAVNIHYTEIAALQALLPQDNNAMILVYCQTGRRAGIAAFELAELGYTNIFVFPGMIDWEGETVTS